MSIEAPFERVQRRVQRACARVACARRLLLVVDAPRLVTEVQRSPWAPAEQWRCLYELARVTQHDVRRILVHSCVDATPGGHERQQVGVTKRRAQGTVKVLGAGDVTSYIRIV